MTDAYNHSLKPVLENGSTDQQSNTLIIRILGAVFMQFVNKTNYLLRTAVKKSILNNVMSRVKKI